MQRQVTYLWKEPGVTRSYRSAVSLHGHTNHSKESLYFIVEYAARRRLLRWALSTQEKRAQSKSSITVDFWKAYWTPPLPPVAAFELERNQIENTLGLNSLISLTDHDNIEAPMLLRVVPEARHVPVSLEWSVPYGNTTLHLGVHNLPSAQAESIAKELNSYTKEPVERRLPGLLRMLHELPEVLVILNHPLWDLAGIGRERHVHTLSAFLAEQGAFVHAFEINGLRPWEENQSVMRMAEGWNQIVISGGDRHGCEPSAALNLTNADTFSGFIREIRNERRSHILFMPQYKEPFTLRMVLSVLDVIRDYPDYSVGSRHWDERVFHPDSKQVVRPLSALWKKPPGFIGVVFAALRLIETAPVRSVAQFALARPERDTQLRLGNGQEVAP